MENIDKNSKLLNLQEMEKVLGRVAFRPCTGVIQLHLFIKHIYLIGVWSHKDQKANTIFKTHAKKRFE